MSQEYQIFPEKYKAAKVLDKHFKTQQQEGQKQNGNQVQMKNFLERKRKNIDVIYVVKHMHSYPI